MASFFFHTHPSHTTTPETRIVRHAASSDNSFPLSSPPFSFCHPCFSPSVILAFSPSVILDIFNRGSSVVVFCIPTRAISSRHLKAPAGEAAPQSRDLVGGRGLFERSEFRSPHNRDWGAGTRRATPGRQWFWVLLPKQKDLGVRGRHPAVLPSACGAETPHCLPEQILVFAFAEVLVGFGGELAAAGGLFIRHAGSFKGLVGF